MCVNLGASPDTLWLCQQFAIENDPVEIVDFPIENGDFPARYVNLPEGMSYCIIQMLVLD